MDTIKGIIAAVILLIISIAGMGAIAIAKALHDDD